MASYRLKTFGGLSLEANPEAEAAAGLQKNRLAILTVVAAAGQAGISREKLAELFWPESDSERSRNALNQALFGLRRVGGSESLVEGSDILRVNSSICSVDFIELEKAAREGLHDRVIALHTGPFMDGSRFRTNAPLERWVQQKRDSLEDLFSRALRASFEEARSRGDQDTMLSRAQARAGLFPYDADAAECLVRTLCLTGNIDLARRHVAIYERLITDDLEGQPDSRVVAAFNECETTGEIQLSAPSTPVTEHVAVPSAEAVLNSPTEHATKLSNGTHSRGLRMAIIAGSIIVIAAAAGALIRHNMRDRSPTFASGETIAIFPFCVKGDSPNHDLSNGMVDLINASLPGDAGPRPLDPHSTIGAMNGTGKPCDLLADQARNIARRLGATYLLLGDVVSAGKTVVLTARVSRVSAQSFNREISVQSSLDSLNTAIGNFTAQVQAAIVNEPTARMPDILSRSAPALKFYLRGRSLWRSGQKQAAVEAFISSLDADSTFALAGLGLSEAGGWALGGEYEGVRRHLIHVSEIQGRLSVRDEALLHALNGYPPHRRSDSENFHDWEHAVDLAPESPTAWYEYGDRLFHVGAAIGRANSVVDSKRAFERAIALDSSSAMPIAHMVEVSIILREVEAVRKYARLYAAAGAAADSRSFVEWRLAQFLGDNQSLNAIHTRLQEISTPSLQRIAGTSQLENIDLKFGMDAINELTRRQVAPLWQFDVAVRLHDRLINDRNWVDADRAIRKMEASHIVLGYFVDVVSADALRMTDIVFGSADSNSAPALVARLAASSSVPPDGDMDAMRYLGENCALGLWYAARDSVRARFILQRIVSMKPGAQADIYPRNPSVCAAMIEAELAVASNPASAKKSIDHLDSLAALGIPSYGMGFSNQEVARLYQKIGDRPNALRAVRRRRYDWTEAVRYLASSRDLERSLR